MNTKKCRHCGIEFQRSDDSPTPHDRCGRCHARIEEEGIESFKNPSTSAPQYDPVTRPAHYQSESGIEAIDAIRAALGLEGFVSHCRGTAIKYAFRAGKKGNAAECLRKGAWYLERAAKELEQ